MAAVRTHGRHRALVLASLPQVCALCENARAVRLVSLAGLRGTGPVACPHCSVGDQQPLPILTLPMRQDYPKGAA